MLPSLSPSTTTNYSETKTMMKIETNTLLQRKRWRLDFFKNRLVLEQNLTPHGSPLLWRNAENFFFQLRLLFHFNQSLPQQSQKLHIRKQMNIQKVLFPPTHPWHLLFFNLMSLPKFQCSDWSWQYGIGQSPNLEDPNKYQLWENIKYVEVF